MRLHPFTILPREGHPAHRSGRAVVVPSDRCRGQAMALIHRTRPDGHRLSARVPDFRRRK